MKIRCLYDKLVPISELKLNPENRNVHPKEQIERLAEILKYQGWRYCVKVSNLSGMVSSGHGRVEAALSNGWKEVPVNFQDYDDSDQEYADSIADNAIASWAELNLSGIQTDIKGLSVGFNVTYLGLKGLLPEPEKLEPGCDEDEVPEKVEPKTRPGDLYQLGNHRLMCGDSTSIDAVERLMNGEKADMVFTDPPYGMFLNTDYSDMKHSEKFKEGKGVRSGQKYKQVIGDHEDFSPELINTVFANFHEAPEIFMWGADYYAEHLINKNDGSWIVWDKRENADGESNLDKMFGSSFELCWSKNKHKRDIARIRWAMCFGTEKEFDKKRHHPTQKPILLAEWFFARWGNPQDKVVDLFGGSGSTLIACEKTNRRCFMMELDPHYCDIIVARWEKYSGKKAVRLNET